MKNSLKALFVLTISLFTLMVIAPSCKNECKDVICVNGGDCNEETGDCDCPDAYFGARCDSVDLCILKNINLGVTCDNGGTCFDGVCVCIDNFTGPLCKQCKAPLWEGPQCDILVREKMLSKYLVAEKCDGTLPAYEIVVVENINSLDKIFLTNVDGIGPTSSLTASVMQNDSIVIPNSNWTGGGTVEGDGFFDKNAFPQRFILDMTWFPDPMNNPDSTVECTIVAIEN